MPRTKDIDAPKAKRTYPDMERRKTVLPRQGGLARAQALTPAERTAIALKGQKARMKSLRARKKAAA